MMFPSMPSSSKACLHACAASRTLGSSWSGMWNVMGEVIKEIQKTALFVERGGKDSVEAYLHPRTPRPAAGHLWGTEEDVGTIHALDSTGEWTESKLTPPKNARRSSLLLPRGTSPRSSIDPWQRAASQVLIPP